MNKRVCLTLALCLAAGLGSWAFAAEEAKAETAQVAGKWEMTRETPMGTMTTVFDIQQEGETLKGTMSGGPPGRERQAPLTGTVKGNAVEFSTTMTGRDGETRTIEYSGTVEGDAMKLEFEGRGGKREATAKRAAAKTDAPAPESKPATP